MWLGKERFFIEGGGWVGASEGRVMSKFFFFLQIGQTCFIRNRGRVTVFFGKEKITPSRLVSWLSFVNKHAKCVET